MLDMIDPALANDPMLKALAKDPIEPIDRAEPTEPMLSTELREPMDSREFVEPMLQREPERVGEAMGSSCREHGALLAEDPGKFPGWRIDDEQHAGSPHEGAGE